MSDLVGDLRYALRSFRRSPLHALATVLILGVGIGAVTLMFSVLNASVLRPIWSTVPRTWIRAGCAASSASA